MSQLWELHEKFALHKRLSCKFEHDTVLMIKSSFRCDSQPLKLLISVFFLHIFASLRSICILTAFVFVYSYSDRLFDHITCNSYQTLSSFSAITMVAVRRIPINSLIMNEQRLIFNFHDDAPLREAIISKCSHASFYACVYMCYRNIFRMA